MSKDLEKAKGKKTERKKQKITISIIVLAALFIVELYFMMNRSTDYLILGVIALIMLIVVYRIIDLTFKIQDEKAAKSEKEYENLFKSQRMSYLLMKENFEDMYVLLKEIEDNSDLPIEDLIEAQKAVAKVTIHRSKENATALMNSNEKLIEKMFTFEDKLVEIEKAIGLNPIPKMEKVSEVSTDEAVSETEIPEMPVMEEELNEAEIPEMPAMEEEFSETEIPEMSVVEEGIEAADEISMEESQLDVSDDPNHVMTPDEIAQLLGEVNETQAEETAVEEKAAMPDLSDPNHVMTPDEIAALLANVE